MPFYREIDTTGWSKEAQEAFGNSGERRMPLIRSGSCSQAGQKLSAASPQHFFPNARLPECVQAGVLLHLGCWTEAHNVAQEADAPEGSYWHAILHRMEPDSWNSNYWFRRVGTHPIYPELRSKADELSQAYPSAGFRIAAAWNPSEFTEFCEKAAAKPKSEQEVLAQEIQQVEWELLLHWCMK